MHELQNASFTKKIEIRYAAHLRQFFSAIERGKDKEFIWINFLVLAQFKVMLLNHEDRELLDDAWIRYRFGVDFLSILTTVLERIDSVRLYKELTTDSFVDSYHLIDLAYYSLEEMAELGLDKELVEFMNRPSNDYKSFRKLVKDFYENLNTNDEFVANLTFREAFDFNSFFLKSKIWFASDGSITKSYRYEYSFRPSVLKRLENIKNAEEFQTFLRMYFTQTEILETEVEAQGLNNKSIFFENDLVITEKFVARELVKYFAFKEFSEAYPLEFVDNNGTSHLIGKSKEQFDAHCLLGSKILSSSWKGNKSELVALLFSLHKAGYLSGTMEDVLRTFQNLIPSEEKLVQAGRANFNDYITPKDNNAGSRFKGLLDKVYISFETLIKEKKKEKPKKSAS